MVTPVSKFCIALLLHWATIVFSDEGEPLDEIPLLSISDIDNINAVRDNQSQATRDIDGKPDSHTANIPLLLNSEGLSGDHWSSVFSSWPFDRAVERPSLFSALPRKRQRQRYSGPNRKPQKRPRIIPDSADSTECGVQSIPRNRIYLEEDDNAKGNFPISGDEPSRIVNGVDAVAHSWPWQVLLQIGSSICGGTLIHPSFVLTAAHCLRGRTSRATVIIGAHQMEFYHRASPMTVQATGFQHEKFDESTNDNDIALFMLEKPVLFNEKVNLICLPQSGASIAAGTDCIVTGWGRRKWRGSVSNILQEATVPIVDTQKCTRLYSSMISRENEGKILCAGGTGTDTCQGDSDSGGPLVCKVDGKWIQYGITSFGMGCGWWGIPGVYTRLSAHIDWINSNIRSKQPV